MTPTEALEKAIAEAGGSCSKLAALIGVKRQNVEYWRKSGRGVPAEYCTQIEAAVGVPREDLRPDFKWKRLRRARRNA